MDRSEERQLYITVSQVTMFMVTIAALLLLVNDARCASPQSAPKVGEEYEITMRSKVSWQTSDGTSGSSHGRDVILERAIGVHEGGMEFEYDLPKDAKAEDRTRRWQFPVRVFRPTDGSMQLLNRAELEARVDGWLKGAGWTRAACGRWTFTWDAFRIECDLQSVIKAIEAFDLRFADLREGALYKDAEARGPGTLKTKAKGQDGATFVVEMEIDPDAVRRSRADSDVASGEIVGKPVTLDEALRERANESVSGTISVAFYTDRAGNVRRRTKVTKIEIKWPNGRSENQTAAEMVERRRVSEPSTLR